MDGKNIDFWPANWLPCTKNLRSMIQGPISNNDLQLKVWNIKTNDTWDLSNLSFELPPNTPNEIICLQTTTSYNNIDVTMRAPTTNGIFTTKSVYPLYLPI